MSNEKEQLKNAAELAAAVVKLVAAQLEPEGMDVRLADVVKNNGIKLTGISAGSDGLAGTVYIDNDLQMIQDGQATVEDVANRVARKLALAAEQAPFSADGVKEMFDNPDTTRIVLRVVNKEQNAEMLKDTPHRDIHGDLAAIAAYKVSDEGMTVIRNNLCHRMGYTATELLDYAIRNANHGQHVVQSMKEMLAASMGMDPEQAEAMFGADDNNMIVVTNSSKLYGAADIFVDKTLREAVAEKIGGDYYILPSSVHEVICVSADTMKPEEAATMVREVNATQLEPVDVLSDHPYHVDAQTLKITNPCEKMVDMVADAPKHSIHM